MICVLNCSRNEQLRALRHEILAHVACEVSSPQPEEALAQIRRAGWDVLVICNPALDQFGDAMCLEFRRCNPGGRIVAVQGAAGPTAICEPDILVDAYDPKALVEAITSYAEARSKFRYERRLSYSGTGNFLGWSCDRCCWNRREAPAVDREVYRRIVEREFQAHSCEAYAREEWGPTRA